MSQFTTLARPYAKAAFAAAQEAGSLQAFSDGLKLLAAVLSEPKVAANIANPALGAEQKAGLLLELCAEELDNRLQNLVRLLADNKRLPLLPEISVLFESLKAESERSVEVEVITAYALDEAAEAKLVETLKTHLQREVKLSTQTDKSLIGGMLVRAGDLVIDGSVRGKLKKLTETMNA